MFVLDRASSDSKCSIYVIKASSHLISTHTDLCVSRPDRCFVIKCVRLKCGSSQVELVSDKRVFEGFEMDASLRVSLDVEVGDVRLKRFVDCGHDGVPHPGDARPLPQLTLLLDRHMENRVMLLYKEN